MGVNHHYVSNSASAALNKWLKQVAGSDYVIHSFRHSMRDRLRAVNCPSDMINQIGGWSKQSIVKVMARYQLKLIKFEYLAKVILSVNASNLNIFK